MDDYEQIGPLQYVPDAPPGAIEVKSTPAVHKFVAAPPLRDADIDLASNPRMISMSKASEKTKQIETDNTAAIERRSGVQAKSQKPKTEIKKKHRRLEETRESATRYVSV